MVPWLPAAALRSTFPSAATLHRAAPLFLMVAARTRVGQNSPHALRSADRIVVADGGTCRGHTTPENRNEALTGSLLRAAAGKTNALGVPELSFGTSHAVRLTCRSLQSPQVQLERILASGKKTQLRLRKAQKGARSEEEEGRQAPGASPAAPGRTARRARRGGRRRRANRAGRRCRRRIVSECAGRVSGCDPVRTRKPACRARYRVSAPRSPLRPSGGRS